MVCIKTRVVENGKRMRIAQISKIIFNISTRDFFLFLFVRILRLCYL